MMMRKSCKKYSWYKIHSMLRFFNGILIQTLNCLGFTFEQIDLQSCSRERERLAEEVQTLQSLKRDTSDSQQEEQESRRDAELKAGTDTLSHLVTKPIVVFDFMLSVWSGFLLRN